MPRWRADHRTKRKTPSLCPCALPRAQVLPPQRGGWKRLCVCAISHGQASTLGCELHVMRHYQNFLDFILVTFHVVEHHVLSNVLTVLQLVQLIICVCVEYRPTQELCQGLGKGKRRKQWNSHYMFLKDTEILNFFKYVWYIFKETQAQLWPKF